MAPDGTHRVLGACALDCPDTGSWVVTVKDGRAVRLQGDAEHPFTRGVLCNNVNGYVAYTQSPDRLVHPMRRLGPKGRGEFERTKGRFVKGGATVNATVDERDADMGGGAVFHDNRVEIERL